MKPTLFYDGGCPLCRKEINHYIRIDSGNAIEWIDITQQKERLDSEGLSFTETMRLIHARDRQGNLQIGVYAFLTIWEHLPGYRWLGKLIKLTRTARPINWAYYKFANWRYARRCKSGCAVPQIKG